MNKSLKRMLGIVDPKHVNGQLALRTGYYRAQLRRIIKGIFEVKCPIEWNIDYMLNLLLFEGYVLITETSAGILPIRSAIYGYNYTGFPTDVNIAVPVLGDFDRRIGVNSELIYLEWAQTANFYTFNQMVQIFAEKLASCDAAIDVNVMNSKLAYIAESDTKGQAETIKKIIDQVNEGEPLVVYRKDSLATSGLQLLTNNLKQNYIAIDLQDTKRTLYNEFLTALGINNANTDKKERLLTSEVDSNDEELVVNMALIEENIERCLKRVKKLYPDLELDIKLRFDSRSRETKNESGDNKDDTNGDNRNMETSE